MSEDLTPDEAVVYREFLRLGLEPNEIPPQLSGGFLERLAESCNMSLERVTAATQGLIARGKFDTPVEGDDG